MSAASNHDPERERLVETILDLEARSASADDEAERAREQALAREAEARDLRETLLGMRRHLERLDRPGKDQPPLSLVPTPEGQQPAPDGIPPFAPQREDGILAIISRDLRKWSYLELHEEFVRRGWDNPKAKHEIAAIRAAVYRLAKLGRIELGPARGEFRYKMPPTNRLPVEGEDP